MAEEVNGIINVYKEAGFTSHDVVAKLHFTSKKDRPYRNIGSGGDGSPSGMLWQGDQGV